jgi:hypothetical protein
MDLAPTVQETGCESLRAIAAGLEGAKHFLRHAGASGPLSRWLDCCRPFRRKRRHRGRVKGEAQGI